MKKCALIALVCIAGCSQLEPKSEPVSGRVTFQGNPLADGMIEFASTGETKILRSTTIKNGDYRLEVPAGDYRVAVRNASSAGPTAGPDQAPLPEKYNAKTTLTAVVKPDEENVANFDLK